MTVEEKLKAILDIVQVDVCGRGLRTDPNDNLITATAGDFEAACRRLADGKVKHVGIVTGFTIPTASPPVGETDGPLGSLYLARALAPLGYTISLISDGTTLSALQAGVNSCIIDSEVQVVELPPKVDDPIEFCKEVFDQSGQIDLLVSVERVGPAHGEDRACYSMRGTEMSALTRPAHLLFEGIPSIGIGDGGNEIGMGKLPRALIAQNIANGDKVACRIATSELIVAGISNWGAYALAAGVCLCRGEPFDDRLFDVQMERQLLQLMTEAGPLIDGVTGQPTLSVDGLPLDRYIEPLSAIAETVKTK